MENKPDWQDVMIENFGSKWLEKKSYSLTEIGRLAKIISSLLWQHVELIKRRNEIIYLKKELALEREIIDDIIMTDDHDPCYDTHNCDFNHFKYSGKNLLERARARQRERK